MFSIDTFAVTDNCPSCGKIPNILVLAWGNAFGEVVAIVPVSLCLGQVAVLLYYVDLKWRNGVQVAFRVPDFMCLVAFSVWFCSHWVGGLSRSIFLQKSHLEWRPPHENHFSSYPLISFFAISFVFVLFTCAPAHFFITLLDAPG